jgi:quercetin dioxygenase-like cupin family protein
LLFVIGDRSFNLTFVDEISEIVSKSNGGNGLSAYTNLNQNLTYFIAKKLESLSLKLNTGKVIPSFAVQPDQGDRFQVLAVANSQRVIKVRGSQTDGRLMIMEGEILVGEGPPIHIHHREDEYFHVLKGEIEFEVGDRKILGKEGTWVYAPRYIKHRYRNVNSTGARLEFVFQPAGIEDYFEEVSRVIVAQQPDWQEQAAAVADKYDIELLGTPDWTG